MNRRLRILLALLLTVFIGAGCGGEGTGGGVLGLGGLGVGVAVIQPTPQAGPPAFVFFLTEPARTVAPGVNFFPPVQIVVQDQFGFGVPEVSVALSVAPTGAGVTLVGNPVAFTDSNGVATFAALTVIGIGQNLQLVAVANGLFARSDLFASVPLPGSPAAIAYVVQPSSATAGQVITPPVQVRMTDVNGSPVAAAGVTLTLSGGAPLGGTTTQTTDSNGLATFSDLSVGSPASGLVLLATATGLQPVQSAVFNVTP